MQSVPNRRLALRLERVWRLWWCGLGGRSFDCGSQKRESSLRMTGYVGGVGEKQIPFGNEKKEKQRQQQRQRPIQGSLHCGAKSGSFDFAQDRDDEGWGGNDEEWDPVTDRAWNR